MDKALLFARGKVGISKNRPGHRTIYRFREQHLQAFEQLFVQVVQIASGIGVVKMGTLAIDGTKIKSLSLRRLSGMMAWK